MYINKSVTDKRTDKMIIEWIHIGWLNIDQIFQTIILDRSRGISRF